VKVKTNVIIPGTPPQPASVRSATAVGPLNVENPYEPPTSTSASLKTDGAGATDSSSNVDLEFDARAGVEDKSNNRKGELTMTSKISILGALALCLSLTANAQLNNPNGLAFDSAGHLWVANAGADNVLELNATTGAVLNTITKGVNDPTRLLFVGSDLYVQNTAGNNITIYSSLGTPGAKLAGTINIPPTASRSLGSAVDAYGDVYVSGGTSNSIIALNIGGDLVETLTQDKNGFPFTVLPDRSRSMAKTSMSASDRAIARMR